MKALKVKGLVKSSIRMSHETRQIRNTLKSVQCAHVVAGQSGFSFAIRMGGLLAMSSKKTAFRLVFRQVKQ